METLIEHIQALPAELSKEILDLYLSIQIDDGLDEWLASQAENETYRPPFGLDGRLEWCSDKHGAVKISFGNNYKPPTPLRLNKASRAAFAKTYYGSGHVFFFQDRSYLRDWLKSLEPAHREMIEVIKYSASDDRLRHTHVDVTFDDPPFNVEDMMQRIGEETGRLLLEDKQVRRMCEGLSESLSSTLSLFET